MSEPESLVEKLQREHPKDWRIAELEEKIARLIEAAKELEYAVTADRDLYSHTTQEDDHSPVWLAARKLRSALAAAEEGE